MPQQPLGGEAPEVGSHPATAPLPVVAGWPELLLEQRADMVIRLPWRPVGRLTSISMLASSWIVAYLAASSSVLLVDFYRIPRVCLLFLIAVFCDNFLAGGCVCFCPFLFLVVGLWFGFSLFFLWMSLFGSVVVYWWLKSHRKLGALAHAHAHTPHTHTNDGENLGKCGENSQRGDDVHRPKSASQLIKAVASASASFDFSGLPPFARRARRLDAERKRGREKARAERKRECAGCVGRPRHMNHLVCMNEVKLLRFPRF